MSKLFEALKLKKESVAQTEMAETGNGLQKYNRTWVSRIALHNGYEISDDNKKVDGILSALNRKNGQCPCGGNGAQFKCPCVIMRNMGICKCGLFKTIEDRKVTSASSSAKIKTNDE